MLKSTHNLLHMAVVLAASISSCLAVDIAERRSDNAKIRGEFKNMGVNEITVTRTNGEEVTISVADLKSVQFDGEPTTLTPARANERSGALDAALTKMSDIQKTYGGSDTRLKKELEFLVARIKGKQALTDPAKVDEAIDALNKFRTENKTNFRYLEATLLQASVHGLKGEVDEGKALLTEVQQSPVAGFQLQAGVDLGRLLLKSGDAAGAESAFEDVIARSKGKADAAAAMYDSMLGKALCLKAQNQIDEAVTTLNEVIDKAPPAETRTLAEAWVRKGDCFRQQQQVKPALMAYLHVDVLYSGEPAQHAEALLRLSELWGPAGHQDRAVEASTQLGERYPNSEWARKISGGG